MLEEIMHLQEKYPDKILLVKFCAEFIEVCAVKLQNHWNTDIKIAFEHVLQFCTITNKLIGVYCKIFRSKYYRISESETLHEWIRTIENSLEGWLKRFVSKEVKYEECSLFSKNVKHIEGVYISLDKKNDYDDSILNAQHNLEEFEYVIYEIKYKILPINDSDATAVKRYEIII